MQGAVVPGFLIDVLSPSAASTVICDHLVFKTKKIQFYVKSFMLKDGFHMTGT